MKYYKLNFIIILFLTFGCQKQINNNNNSSIPENIPEKKSPSLLDTIANCKWVFTEYHDKVNYQTLSDSTHIIGGTAIMSIISDGNETASLDFNGKIFLKRNNDFSFATIDYFNSAFHNVSFVSKNYTDPYYDTANYNLANKSIILTKPVKYLPDSMSILIADTACLVLSGKLHINGYDINRTIIFYKNTRWYGGYRNYSGL